MPGPPAQPPMPQAAAAALGCPPPQASPAPPAPFRPTSGHSQSPSLLSGRTDTCSSAWRPCGRSSSCSTERSESPAARRMEPFQTSGLPGALEGQQPVDPVWLLPTRPQQLRGQWGSRWSWPRGADTGRVAGGWGPERWSGTAWGRVLCCGCPSGLRPWAHLPWASSPALASGAPAMHRGCYQIK